MIFRCKETFTTSESGMTETVREGTVWMASHHRPSRGGYELTQLREIEGGCETGAQATIRTCRLSEHFEPVPAESCIPSFAYSGYSYMYDDPLGAV